MDSQQQFCLKWNSFGTNLATTFGNLFKSESLADVTLFCEGVTFKAHKLILAACSKHFQDLFETAPVCPSVLVILDGTSSSNMSALLEFMYKGEVHVSQESLSSFLKAAECLQVKGLSIEHEKLAVVHSSRTTSTMSHESQLDSPTGRKQPKPNSLSKENLDVNSEQQQQQPPMPPQSQHHQQHHASTSYSPALYMHPHHYRYEQRVPASPSHYDAPPPRKRHHRSSSEVMQDAAVRASVLRDGSKSSEMLSPLSLAYRSSVAQQQQQQQQQSQQQPPPPPPPPELELKVEPDSFIQSPHHVRYDTTSESNNTATTVTYDRTAAVDADNNTCPASSDGRRSSVEPGSSCPEDLRVKLEITGSHSDDQHTNTAPYSDANTEQAPEMIPTNVWNSSASIKMSPQKGSSMSTPDGKKLKCPFCERLYGYETNLRAHIRQRHQGIRVPCPFCSRTFTRNNTVRRHIAREHKTEYSLKVFQQAQVHNHNNQ